MPLDYSELEKIWKKYWSLSQIPSKLGAKNL